MCWRSYISYMGWSALVHGIGLIVGYLGEYTVLYTMIHNFPGVGGYTALEICFLYGTCLVAYALGNLHTREFWRIDDLVLQGQLDQYLVRPVSPLLYLMVKDIQVGYISHLILGIGSMMMVKGLLGLHWGMLRWTMYGLMLLSGGILMGGISLIATPLTFWWGRAGSVVSFLRWSLKDAATYPVTIYPEAIRHLLFIVPYAFVNYIPSLYLLRKAVSPYAVWYPVVSLVVGVAINLLFVAFWHLGLRRYNSSGS